MASSGGPEAELHDPRRKELLQALKDALSVDTVAPTAWACVWLSDIDSLAYLVTQAQALPISIKALFQNIETGGKLVPTWTQRTRPGTAGSSSQPPSTPLQPSPPQQTSSAQGSRGKKRNNSGQLIVRSKQQRDLCHQRDQKRCTITKAGEPNEVAHIYPFSMRQEDNRSIFWETLRVFWSTERVDAWYNAIFPLGTEVCQNLICLAPHAHAYWQKAHFALKPIRISDDKKRLNVQFFWLPQRSYFPNVNILQAPRLPVDLDQGPNFTMLYNVNHRREICSGDEITFETDDPVSQPLPDFRLLEMQWFLHRVTAISAAAEPRDDFHEESDDDIERGLHDLSDTYTDDHWAAEISRSRFSERYSLARPFGVNRLGLSLRGGGYDEEEDHEEEDHDKDVSEREDLGI